MNQDEVKNIEVEKKFTIKDSQKQKLLNGARFISEKTFRDIYYDDTRFSLTSNDKWLRMRDNKFELKLPLADKRSPNFRKLDQYKELTNNGDISNSLSLDKNIEFEQSIKKSGYIPFCKIVTTRKKYEKSGFIIDLDELDFGYSLGEIELMVENENQMDEAMEQIMMFAKENGISTTSTRGKVIEYLRRKSPEHYQALIKAGVVIE